MIRLAGEDPVHDISAVHDHRADLLAVDRLCRGRAAVADQARDVLDRHVGVGKQRDEAMPQLARSPLARLAVSNGAGESGKTDGAALVPRGSSLA